MDIPYPNVDLFRIIGQKLLTFSPGRLYSRCYSTRTSVLDTGTAGRDCVDGIGFVLAAPSAGRQPCSIRLKGSAHELSAERTHRAVFLDQPGDFRYPSCEKRRKGQARAARAGMALPARTSPFDRRRFRPRHRNERRTLPGTAQPAGHGSGRRADLARAGRAAAACAATGGYDGAGADTARARAGLCTATSARASARDRRTESRPLGPPLHEGQ